MQVSRQPFGMNRYGHEYKWKDRWSILKKTLLAETQESFSCLQDPCQIRSLPVKVQLKQLTIKQMPL